MIWPPSVAKDCCKLLVSESDGLNQSQHNSVYSYNAIVTFEPKQLNRA